MDVGLIRDLAMGINPDGADSWMNQEAYVSGLRCGAPPDDFQPKGQEWGVLPLDPVRLRRNLAPFAQLLRANMRHAGGLRIDHVIGVQRQFLVPLGAEAKSGAMCVFRSTICSACSRSKARGTAVSSWAKTSARCPKDSASASTT